MHSLRRFATAALVALFLVSLTALDAPAQVTIDWVTVGDPGNANDTRIEFGQTVPGYGKVDYEYRIGKYEVTIGQYAEFLNAAAKTDPYGLWDQNMETDLNIAGIARTGTTGAYQYDVMTVSGSAAYGGVSNANRPITYVGWFDAARFANWMHNGQGNGSTETGAYTLNGSLAGRPVKNEGARFYIPSEDEWYKAAYYKGGSTDAGYWDFATQSDTAPKSTIGSGANQANYQGYYPLPINESRYAVTQTSALDYSASQNYLTDVGAFSGSPSAYGTFDQNGNVYEWNDLSGLAGSTAGLRGGSWSDYEQSRLTAQYRNSTTASGNGSHNTGFRLASLAPAPDILLHIASGTQTQGAAGYPLLTPVNAASVTKTGGGTVVFDIANTFSSSLVINEGTVIAANVQAIGTATLEVASGATFAVSPLIGAANPVQLTALGDISGTIELDTGRFSLPAAAESPEAQLRNLLISGRNGGGWNGDVGIVSTAAAESAGTRAAGYVVSPDGSAVVAFAAPGDTDLNGKVDVFDLVSINSSGRYGSGQSAVWNEGDFNYDGVTNVFDLVGINTAGAYGQGNYLPATPTGTAVTAVPEPSTYAMALAGVACGGYLVRRRRKRA